jgi:hypothetical protein
VKATVTNTKQALKVTITVVRPVAGTVAKV